MTIRAYSFSKYIVPVINTTAVKSCTAEVGLCQGPDASHSEQLQHPNTALPCAVQFLSLVQRRKLLHLLKKTSTGQYFNTELLLPFESH